MQLLSVHGWQNCRGRVKFSKHGDAASSHNSIRLSVMTQSHTNVQQCGRATRPPNLVAKPCAVTTARHATCQESQCAMMQGEELLGGSSQEQLRSSVVQCTRYATAMEGSIAVHAVD